MLLQSVYGGVTLIDTATGQPAQVCECLVDERGYVYLDTDLGLGLVHTQDVGQLAHAVEQGRWVPHEVQSGALAARFGYVASPATEQILLSKE